MTTDTLRYAAIMLLAGIGIPMLAALNARLGARIGAPVAASVVLFAVALLACVIVLVLSRQGAALAQLPAQPKYLFGAGLFVAFYVLAVTWVAPRFGVGNAVFCVLLGQMIAATAIDHFGLFGAIRHPISVWRGAGLAAMTCGLVLIQRG
jgi:bacterial/archaeal transporter family-2 protein